MSQKMFCVFIMATIIPACGVKGPPEPPLINEANSSQQAKTAAPTEATGKPEAKLPVTSAPTPQVFPANSSEKTSPTAKKKKK